MLELDLKGERLTTAVKSMASGWRGNLAILQRIIPEIRGGQRNLVRLLDVAADVARANGNWHAASCLDDTRNDTRTLLQNGAVSLSLKGNQVTALVTNLAHENNRWALQSVLPFVTGGRREFSTLCDVAAEKVHRFFGAKIIEDLEAAKSGCLSPPSRRMLRHMVEQKPSTVASLTLTAIDTGPRFPPRPAPSSSGTVRFFGPLYVGARNLRLVFEC